MAKLDKKPGYLYEKIVFDIADKIKRGEYKEGFQLPIENELENIYNVSRITIRRAIKELVKKGYLEIVRGKGTYVKGMEINLKILNISGFGELGNLDNHKIRKYILDKRYVSTKGLLYIFKTNNLDSKFLKLERLIYDNDIPIAFDIAYFPDYLYPNISEKITDSTSTFDLIQKEYKVVFKGYEKNITIINNDNIAKKLNILPTEPLCKINKIIQDKYKNVVHFSTYYTIAKHTKITLSSEDSKI